MMTNIGRKTQSIALISAALLSVFPFFGSVCAENWAQFRGSTNQGISIESDAPLTWSDTQNIAWRTAIPGSSWSSPIVWNDRVFVTTATDQGASCRVLAIDAGTGMIIWDKEVFRQELLRKEDRNTYATPTPATDGQRVYACFGDGSFVALDFFGNVVWGNREYKYYSQHGLGSSPILHEGLLIMARDGSSDGPDKSIGWQKPWDQSYVLALDAITGKERWKGKRGMSRISHGCPCIWNQLGRAQVISEAGDVVQGFDLNSGERLWSSEVLGEGKVPSTLLGDGVVFTSGGWGGKESIKAFKLGPIGDLRESNLLWEQKKGMPKVASMVYVKPNLYAITDAGIATCMTADTGEILWQNRIGGNFAASPISVAGRIYFTDDMGTTTVVAAKSEYEILAKNTLNDSVQASPAFSQGRLFLRSKEYLYCIGK